MMMGYSWIFCIIIAVILVAVKLILEHQQDLDRKDGVEQDRSSYTMTGMLKLMIEDKKVQKKELRESKRPTREMLKSQSHSLSIKQFDD